MDFILIRLHQKKYIHSECHFELQQKKEDFINPDMIFFLMKIIDILFYFLVDFTFDA